MSDSFQLPPCQKCENGVLVPLSDYGRDRDAYQAAYERSRQAFDRGAWSRAAPAERKKVMHRIADWDWQRGLHPAPDAPVWPMDAIRDRLRINEETIHLAAAGVGGDMLITAPSQRTTAKLRVLAGQQYAPRQQVIRIDTAASEPVEDDIERRPPHGTKNLHYVACCRAVDVANEAQGAVVVFGIDPAGAWQAAEPLGAFTLVSCTVSRGGMVETSTFFASAQVGIPEHIHQAVAGADVVGPIGDVFNAMLLE